MAEAPSTSSIMAATISPLAASGWERTTTQSPSQIAASIIESPCTSSMKSSPSPVRRRGRAMTSVTSCSARIGAPAAMRPTSGTATASPSSTPGTLGESSEVT